MCKLKNNKPIENNGPALFPNFEFPMYEMEEESEKDSDIPEQITQLLEHEEKII